MRRQRGPSAARLAAASFLLSACAGCCPAPTAAPALRRALPPQRFRSPAAAEQKTGERALRILSAAPELKAFLASRLSRPSSSGLAAAVVCGGERIWSLGLGVRDAGTQEPITPETVFRIGSITKTFTGMALLQLRDAGALDLDDPVARWVPEIGRAIYPTADSPRISLRHLVTHSSGLPRVGRLEYTDPDRAVTEQQLLDSLAELELVFVPGTRTEYSNLAMALAGLVVGRASGMPYRDYVSERILRPLGMDASVWDREATAPERLATGYRKQGDALVPAGHWRLGAAEAMGGLYSTLADMSRYAAFQLSAWPPSDRPDLGPLRRSSIRESHLVAGFGQPGGESFGVNWAPSLVRHPQLGLVVSHTGATLQYSAAVWMLPERDLGVVLLANTGDYEALSAMAAGMLAIILSHDPEPAPRLSAPLARALERSLALLAEPSREGIEALFSSGFLEAIPAEQMLAFLARTGELLGRCDEATALRAPGEHSAVVRLGCAKGSAELTLHVEPVAPFAITGFAIRPLRAD
ncbi:MAG: beta-lactamase family protein [Deltaproteobacteria bacterium]|nr:beta-lactamase family protein [Deltaproteobacteria bacterium]